MSVWAIGDLQGCLDPLLQLLDTLGFDPACDRLWFVGDLVNRGPQSLECLRFVRDLGETAITVLGNHDLNLLAVAHAGRRPKSRDTLDGILNAPDRDELLHWLRHQPLLHHDTRLGWTLIHAGLPREWDIATAQRAAREVESALQGPDFTLFLREMFGDEPANWSESLQGIERLRYSTNALTRMRYCTPQGQLEFQHKGPPGTQPDGLLPWFALSDCRWAGEKLVFGHWSTLGDTGNPNVRGIDNGCLWGGRLTALRLDGPTEEISLPCTGHRRPG
ncbi:MAG: symmetrical bis(5'-nucleosyl)-tetraphosphatase [Pseudomonadota bacterium]